MYFDSPQGNLPPGPTMFFSVFNRVVIAGTASIGRAVGELVAFLL